MSDLIRDEFRSVVATVIERAPEPVPFEQVRRIRPGRPARRPGPALALAAFAVVLIVIGAVALLNPSGGGGPVVTDPTTTTPGTETTASDPAGSGGVSSPRVLVGEIPDGLGLETVVGGTRSRETVALSYGPFDATTDAGLRPQLEVSTLWPVHPAGSVGADVALERLRSAYPDGSVTQTTVRDRPAFLVEVGPADDGGWTTGLLILESDRFVSELLGTGISPDELLAAGRSLASVDEETLERRLVEEIDWDLRVVAAPEDADRYLQALRNLDSVVSVERRRFVWGGNSPSRVVESGSSTPAPSTSFEPVDALVRVAEGADVDVVGAAIAELGSDGRAVFSPAIARQRAAAFTEAALADAVLLQDDPAVYQPARPEPRFDTAGFGIEVPLVPAAAAGDLPSDLPERLSNPIGVPFPPEDQEPPEGPFIHIGTVGDAHLVVGLDGPRPEYVSAVLAEGVGEGGPSSFARFVYGVDDTLSLPSGAYIHMRVPTDTVVYTYQLADGTRYWQRPAAGHGLLPIGDPSGTTIAYDTDGNVIGQWSGWPEFSAVQTPTTPGLGDEPSQSPSQSPDAAQRDGVVPDLARLPLDIRSERLVEVDAAEGTWVLSRASRELIDMSADDGCGFGDLAGTYPTDVICTAEYGEILLVDDTEQIVRAYPMPGAIPSWIHLTPTAVFAGRVGDGGLPDSTIVRIDRATLQAAVLVVPADSETGMEWPPRWNVASPEQAALYRSSVGFAPDMIGVPVTSWIGDVVVDIEAVDRLMTAGTVDGPVLASPPTVSGDAGGMAAEVTGGLHFEQTTRCLTLELEGVRYPVVWPAGTTWQDDPPAVVLKNGQTAEPGMTVYGAGGYLYRDHVEQLAGSTVADAAEACAGPTGEIAFFNIASEVDVIAGERG